jgi:hypothetical protein
MYQHGEQQVWNINGKPDLGFNFKLSHGKRSSPGLRSQMDTVAEGLQVTTLPVVIET